ncbi:UNVERIFIED_CONTAM: hypothetical protein Scaly_1913000 [Sesamum calycinum]|uniref:Uncharacterized protein n=1 Tax=Sesamum calycinum TaxID=2727403 RepID=A0AAW2NI14_9LAMI
MFIDSTIEQINGVLAFIKGHRKNRFAASMNIAKDLAFDVDVEPSFLVKRRVLRKNNMAIASLRNKFEELKRFESIFGFLIRRASAEMSFLKLKLLKTYLKSSMSQERLNGLVILCIEKHMLGKIEVDSMIDDFASMNA